ncbi:MAG: PAS domain-containing protein, partial [Rhodospirillales bacterium]|nr:PAS domain-containing protein [Rhodospirillales bacterium]
MTETTGSIIIVVAPGGAILEFNPAAEQLLGVPREEAMGSNYFQTFLSEGNCQTAFEVSRRMLAGQASI